MQINVARGSRYMTADAPALVAALTSRGVTVATAESLTGGQLAAALTSVPGASACFVGGVVSYATAVKVWRSASRRASSRSTAQCRPSAPRRWPPGRGRCSQRRMPSPPPGLPGPTGQEGHPAGHVWIACAGPEGVETRLLSLDGDRAAVQAASCRGAMSVLDGMLRKEDSGLG